MKQFYQIKKHSKNISIIFVVYIAILLVVLVSWKEIDTAPPMYLRVLFVAASLLPTYLYPQSTLPIIACFSTISFYGYAHTYFPAELTFILPMMLLLALITRRESGDLNKSNSLMLLLAIYTAFVDLLTSGAINPISMSFLMIFTFEILLKNDEVSFHILGYALCVASLVLSYEFFFVGDAMITEYTTIGMSRVFLRDPNYYGAIIAAGAVVAFREQINPREKTMLEKTLYVLTIALTFVTVVLNASRGAMLSLSLCMALLILYYPTKMKYKFVILIVAIVGIVVLYQNGFFDLLQYRIESDSGTGSNRTVIWDRKISSFLQEGSILNLLFGFGNTEALKLGMDAAFHNDFIAMLVEYGFFGLIMLICMVLRPLFLSCKNNQIEIVILVLFFILECSTIEPITAGRYAHLFFYIYVEKLVSLNKERLKIHH